MLDGESQVGRWVLQGLLDGPENLKWCPTHDSSSIGTSIIGRNPTWCGGGLHSSRPCGRLCLDFRGTPNKAGLGRQVLGELERKENIIIEYSRLN